MPNLPSDLAQQVATALRRGHRRRRCHRRAGPGRPTCARARSSPARRPSSAARPGSTETFRQLDPTVRARHGTRTMVSASLRIKLSFEVSGLARPVLTGERTALNFLQLLSAHGHSRAPLRRCHRRDRLRDPRYAQDSPGIEDGAEIRGPLRRRAKPPHRPVRPWCSSRKTTSPPPARSPAAIAAGRRAAGNRKVEVEVETLAEFEEALRGRARHHHARRIQPRRTCRAAVQINRAKGRPVKLEASGSVTLETVRASRGNRRGLHFDRRDHEARPGRRSVDAARVCASRRPRHATADFNTR